ASRNVILATGTTLQPTAVKVDTSSGGSTYTFSGSGSIGGTASLTVNHGTLFLNNTTPNTYTRQTTVNDTATLKLGQANSLPIGAAVAVNGTGTLDLNGKSAIVSDLTNSFGGIITNTNATASILTYLGANSTFPGAIRDGAGTVALTVSTGTLTLSN